MPRPVAVFFSTCVCLLLGGLAFLLDGPLGLGRHMARFISGGGWLYVSLSPYVLLLIIAGGVFAADLLRYLSDARGRWWAGSLTILAVTAAIAAYFHSMPDARPGAEIAFLYCGVLAALVNAGARELAGVLGWELEDEEDQASSNGPGENRAPDEHMEKAPAERVEQDKAEEEKPQAQQATPKAPTDLAKPAPVEKDQ